LVNICGEIVNGHDVLVNASVCRRFRKRVYFHRPLHD